MGRDWPKSNTSSGGKQRGNHANAKENCAPVLICGRIRQGLVGGVHGDATISATTRTCPSSGLWTAVPLPIMVQPPFGGDSKAANSYCGQWWAKSAQMVSSQAATVSSHHSPRLGFLERKSKPPHTIFATRKLPAWPTRPYDVCSTMANLNHVSNAQRIRSVSGTTTSDLPSVVSPASIILTAPCAGEPSTRHSTSPACGYSESNQRSAPVK